MQGARNGPWMDEDPVGPRHSVAGGPVGYEHRMRDGMEPGAEKGVLRAPHNSPVGLGNHGTLGVGRWQDVA